MPADADLLCEFYLSSQLSSTKSATLLQQQQQQQSRGSNQPSSNYTVDTIDFVKYTKNAMSDGLKRKYELLTAPGHNHNHHQQQPHNNIANGSCSTSVNTTPNSNNNTSNHNIAQHQHQQQQSASLASAITSASNGIKSTLAASSSPTSPPNGQRSPNGLQLNGHNNVKVIHCQIIGSMVWL